MGQAKKRGTPAERIAAAKARMEALKPEYIVCNQCQAHITDITILDARGLEGIEGVFSGRCECGHDTLAMKGDPEAVAMAMEAFAASVGHPGIMGAQLIENQ